MTTVREQVSELIEAHCEAHAEYRQERYRVTMAELSGQPDPKVIASVEESLSKVYGLIHESSERLAAVAALVEFTQREEQNG